MNDSQFIRALIYKDKSDAYFCNDTSDIGRIFNRLVELKYKPEYRWIGSAGEIMNEVCYQCTRLMIDPTPHTRISEDYIWEIKEKFPRAYDGDHSESQVALVVYLIKAIFHRNRFKPRYWKQFSEHLISEMNHALLVNNPKIATLSNFLVGHEELSIRFVPQFNALDYTIDDVDEVTNNFDQETILRMVAWYESKEDRRKIINVIEGAKSSRYKIYDNSFFTKLKQANEEDKLAEMFPNHFSQQNEQNVSQSPKVPTNQQGQVDTTALQVLLDNMSGTINSQSAELQQLRAGITQTENLNKALLDATADFKKIQDENEKAKELLAESEQYQTKISELNNKVSVLEKELEEKVTNEKRFEKRVADIDQGWRETIIGERSDHNFAIQEKNIEIYGLKGELEELKKELATYKTRTTHQDQQIKELEAENERLNKSNTDSASNLDESKKKAIRMIIDMTKGKESDIRSAAGRVIRITFPDIIDKYEDIRNEVAQVIPEDEIPDNGLEECKKRGPGRPLSQLFKDDEIKRQEIARVKKYLKDNGMLGIQWNASKNNNISKMIFSFIKVWKELKWIDNPKSSCIVDFFITDCGIVTKNIIGTQENLIREREDKEIDPEILKKVRALFPT